MVYEGPGIVKQIKKELISILKLNKIKNINISILNLSTASKVAGLKINKI